MPSGHGTFQFQTDGGGGKLAVAAVAGIGVYLAYETLGGAAQAFGNVAAIVITSAVSLAAGAVIGYAAVRLRRRRRVRRVAVYDAKAVQPAGLWRQAAAPSYIPVSAQMGQRRGPGAIAPPVVNVHIDASLLAGLVDAARRQPEPVRAEVER